jgi:hypothetical protein
MDSLGGMNSEAGRFRDMLEDGPLEYDAILQAL